MLKELNRTESGAVIGRFHLDHLHAAHIDLINTVLAKHSRVFVFLGCSTIRNTPRAPLDFKHRKAMLEEQFGDKLEIHPIYDNRSDETWSKNLDREIIRLLPPGQSTTLYGSRDSFIKHYKGRFKTVELESETFISASQVRKEIITNYPSSKDFRAGMIAATGQHYPTAYQTVDIAVVNEAMDQVLLVKKPGESKWRFIGGFSDPSSNSLEDDAKREVMEETGVEISEPVYLGSSLIKDWRFRSCTNKIKTALFMATYISGTPEGADDVEAAKWFNLNDLNESNIVEEHHVLVDLFFKKVIVKA